ncbi:hypothetical protein, partial [Staphylococcus epidermidis]|uniref:hypothetical protein n=1 Tax=Staphylococcus epidermidis TaxID=1282 RepID=UPI001C92F133
KHSEDIFQIVSSKIQKPYPHQQQTLPHQITQFHPIILLPSIHTHSTHHIHTIHQFPQPIHLPSYPQQNPLPHY